MQFVVCGQSENLCIHTKIKNCVANKEKLSYNVNVDWLTRG